MLCYRWISFFHFSLKSFTGKNEKELEEEITMQNPVKSMTHISLLHSAVSSLSPISFSHPLSFHFSLSLFYSSSFPMQFSIQRGNSITDMRAGIWELKLPNSPRGSREPLSSPISPHASVPIFCKMGITIVPSSQGDCATELINTGSVL